MHTQYEVKLAVKQVNIASVGIYLQTECKHFAQNIFEFVKDAHYLVFSLPVPMIVKYI